MTPRRPVVAALAISGALALAGCDIAPGSNTSAGVVTGKRLHHGEMQVGVRYSDGSKQWSNVNGFKYRACKVGEPWPACAPAKPKPKPKGPNL